LTCIRPTNSTRGRIRSSANLYLEHFPFIDRLWFGEGFDYNEPPDYWLTEISGIPFGLMARCSRTAGIRGAAWCSG